MHENRVHGRKAGPHRLLLRDCREQQLRDARVDAARDVGGRQGQKLDVDAVLIDRPGVVSVDVARARGVACTWRGLNKGLVV